MFDDAAVRRQTETSPTLMAVRDVLPPQIQVELHDRLSKGSREPFLVPFGQCPGGARIVLDDGGDVEALLVKCRARDHLTQTATCSQCILHMRYELSGYTADGRVEEALP
jgi:hypothetical protein